MDKSEFLARLEQSLSILEENELRDIISEYEQHIDMKVGKGLTEEEAIADFGSFSELTSEILEAYHVRRDYAAELEETDKESERRSRKKTAGTGDRKKWTENSRIHNFLDQIKSMGSWFGLGIRQMWSQICRPFSWIWGKWKKIFLALKTKQRKNRTKDEKKRMERKSETAGGVFRRMWETVKTIFRLCKRAVLWGACLVWNCCWIVFFLFMAAFGVFSLFGLGVLAVLLLEGYPLAGITLGCLGLVLCMFSAAGVCLTFMYRKKEKTQEAELPERKQEKWESWRKEEGNHA